MNKVQMLIQMRIQDNGSNLALEKLSAVVFDALEQDLSGTMNVPLEPSGDMIGVAVDRLRTRNLNDDSLDTLVWKLYREMLYTAQKEKTMKDKELLERIFALSFLMALVLVFSYLYSECLDRSVKNHYQLCLLYLKNDDNKLNDYERSEFCRLQLYPYYRTSKSQ
jgi:hypothetical protein